MQFKIDLRPYSLPRIFLFWWEKCLPVLANNSFFNAVQALLAELTACLASSPRFTLNSTKEKMPAFHHQQESCRVRAFHLNYYPLLNASSTACKKEAHTSHSARKLSSISFQACLGANQWQCFVKFCFRLKFKPEEYLLEDVKFSHLKMFLHSGPNSALAATVNESRHASSVCLCCRVPLSRARCGLHFSVSSMQRRAWPRLWLIIAYYTPQQTTVPRGAKRHCPNL